MSKTLRYVAENLVRSVVTSDSHKRGLSSSAGSRK